MKTLTEITRNVNKTLDFKRDDEMGYMLTYADIISGIEMALEISEKEAHSIFNKILRERRA